MDRVHAVAVLLSADDYDSLVETVDILSDPDEVRALRTAIAELEAGAVSSVDEVRAAMIGRGRLATAPASGTDAAAGDSASPVDEPRSAAPLRGRLHQVRAARPHRGASRCRRCGGVCVHRAEWDVEELRGASDASTVGRAAIAARCVSWTRAVVSTQRESLCVLPR